MSAERLIVTGDADLSAVHRRPAEHLRPYVHRYSGWTAADPATIHLRVMPSGSAVLVVNFESPLLLANRDSGLAERAYQVSFSGLRRDYLETRYSGPTGGVQVDLRPMGAFLLAGIPMSELTDAILDTDQVADLGLTELVDRLWTARTWDERFDVLDRVLTARIAGAVGESPIVRAAWSSLWRTHGLVEVDQLVADAGCSHRHLVALFKEQVGMPPKLMGRVLRFQRASALLKAGYPHGLSSLAAHCGFYDQAHMIREFRSFSGTTPSAFVRTIGPAGLATPDYLDSPQGG